ncbi:hypothetical protein [Kozakia baliensis]|uniref:Uncharacterized protein n=1 Tax=Kozakia baliensis TaxID=153496 RepID=A0A1D8UTG8_9PROT|nr:hypothetical protein [Kozakia baliensis]AOX16940.1 hypothetical protein A0U89_07080 [Kozakia baliensis]GBR25521.1 hypothetical protein AA0488_0669 [Kozakia baliensis NRIC 0488]GEL64012.1 hypothetical protein KBA01_12980 [Kozakia baliensis]
MLKDIERVPYILKTKRQDDGSEKITFLLPMDGLESKDWPQVTTTVPSELLGKNVTRIEMLFEIMKPFARNANASFETLESLSRSARSQRLPR